MHLSKKYLDSFLKDSFKQISALGSYQFFLIIMFFFLIIAQYAIFFKLFFGMITLYILVYILRIFYFKERPTPKKYENIFEKIKASSFPSGHATRSSYLYFILISFFSFKISLVFYLAIILFLIMYSRYYQKKHHISDLLAGFILGFLVYLIFENIFFI